MYQQRHSLRILLQAVLILALASGCVAAQAQPTPTATLAPTNTAVPPTNTVVPTDTEVPSTNTPIPPRPTFTPKPSPTVDKAATQAFQATKDAEASIAKMKKDLEPYGIPLDQGSLAWVQEKTVAIKLESYNEAKFFPIADQKEYKDFLLKVDVDWESSSGLAGCGIIFRSEKNISEGDSYNFLTLRLSGAPAWDIEYYAKGLFDHNVTGKVRYNDLINLKQGATNTYLLLIQGTMLNIYANGGKLGTAESSKRTNGLLAFKAFQESGTTTCTFSNAWLWVLPEASK